MEGYAALRDQAQERLFLAAYGSPLLQALVGLKATDELPRRRPGDEPEHREFVARRAAELRSRIAEGGLGEAALRALVYVGLAERDSDERTFNMLRRIREERGGKVDLATFKQALRDQFLMLLLDPQAALAALPRLLENASAAEIRPMLEDVRRVVTAGGALSARRAGAAAGDRGDLRAGCRPWCCRWLAGRGRGRGCQCGGDGPGSEAAACSSRSADRPRHRIS